MFLSRINSGKLNLINEEFGLLKPNRRTTTHRTMTNRTPPRKTTTSRTPTRRTPTRKPPTKKAAATPKRYTLTSDNLALMPVDNGRGQPQDGGSGLSLFYDNNNQSSTGNLLPPPRFVRATDVKQSKASSLFGIASQFIAGWSPNKTVQTADGQIPIYDFPNQQQSNSTNSKYPTNLNNDGGAGANVGASLGSGFDGIISWASGNPLIVLLGAGGIYLLFRQPPKFGGR